MYAIALLRYRKPLEDVVAVTDEHRAYLRRLKEEGRLIVSGPFDPRYGGALILRIPDEEGHAGLDRIRDGDPFTIKGIAQYELLEWKPGIGKEDLDKL